MISAKVEFEPLPPWQVFFLNHDFFQHYLYYFIQKPITEGVSHNY